MQLSAVTFSGRNIQKLKWTSPGQNLFNYYFTPVLAIFIDLVMAATSTLPKKGFLDLVELCLLEKLGIELVCSKTLLWIELQVEAVDLESNSVSALQFTKYFLILQLNMVLPPISLVLGRIPKLLCGTWNQLRIERITSDSEGLPPNLQRPPGDW